MRRILLNITTEILLQAQPANCRRCAIALAWRPHLPTGYYVHVSVYLTEIFGPKHPAPVCTLPHTAAITRLIRQLDEKQPVAPCTRTIRVPENAPLRKKPRPSYVP